MNSYDESDKKIICDYADICGNCSYAGVPYIKQLKKKQKYVEGLFSGMCKVEPIVGMYRPIHYRNKVHAVVGRACPKAYNLRDVSYNTSNIGISNKNIIENIKKDKNNRVNTISTVKTGRLQSASVIAGSYMEDSHQLIDITGCMLEDKQCSKIVDTLKQLCNEFKYEPYDEDRRTGWMRHFLLRKGFQTKEIMLVLVTAGVEFPSKNAFIKELTGRHPEITTIVQNINGSRTNMILSDRNKVIVGKGYIEDVLCGCRFRISPNSFYQINHDQTEKLYKAALAMAKLSKEDVLVDAYCGIGTIGIVAASQVRSCIGVELNADAVEDAKLNAKLNNVNNIRFINDDAGRFLVDYAKTGKASVVVMDPPRSGSTPEFLSALTTIKPDRIVYISCNPETQARDVAVLMKAGYKLNECRPYDMFPETSHVENVCLLSNTHKKKDSYVTLDVEMDEYYRLLRANAFLKSK